ncbi:MAG: hypothetical protein GY765_14980 [bacterium]|nr:hypothetical protein [bacterium]
MSEMDNDRNETRRIDIFKDGRVEYAPIVSSSGDDFLGDQPFLDIKVIRADPDLKVAIIKRSEFEKMWKKYVVAGEVYVSHDIQLDFGENDTD